MSHSTGKQMLVFMTVELERLSKYDMFGRFARIKTLLFKKNMAGELRFAKLHLSKLQGTLWA